MNYTVNNHRKHLIYYSNGKPEFTDNLNALGAFIHGIQLNNIKLKGKSKKETK